MMKRIKRIIILFVLIICIASNYVFGLDSWLTDANAWVSGARDNIFTRNTDMYNNANRISGILWIIGLFAFLAVGTITGIKMMFAASIEDKADAKKSMYPLLIGGGIVFGALTIWRILLTTLNGFMQY